jgi:hypothetical protein
MFELAKLSQISFDDRCKNDPVQILIYDQVYDFSSSSIPTHQDLSVENREEI